MLWLTYLGLEPYVRRTSPDSLIGWTRLIAGRWNDPHVGRDVLIGASAGLLMTLLFPLYYLLPPLFGGPEPIPVLPDLRPFMGVRLRARRTGLAGERARSPSGMLGTVGLASFVMLFKRRTLAVAAAILCFTPVAVNGMFNPGYPTLALALGAAIIAIFVFVIVRVGLLGGDCRPRHALHPAACTAHDPSLGVVGDRSALVSGNRRRDRIRRVLHRTRVNGGAARAALLIAGRVTSRRKRCPAGLETPPL